MVIAGSYKKRNKSGWYLAAVIDEKPITIAVMAGQLHQQRQWAKKIQRKMAETRWIAFGDLGEPIGLFATQEEAMAVSGTETAIEIKDIS